MSRKDRIFFVFFRSCSQTGEKQDVLARYSKERVTKKGVTWHAAVKMYLTARDEDERDVIEFEWNLSGAVRKAHETMQQL